MANPSAKGIRTKVQGGQDCSAPTLSASPESLTPSPSDPSSERAKACPSKGKRTLRKPQRIPSIYKLKLRPRIWPGEITGLRSGHHGSLKPLTYLCQPVRAPPKGRLVRAALGSKGRGGNPGGWSLGRGGGGWRREGESQPPHWRAAPRFGGPGAQEADPVPSHLRRSPGSEKTLLPDPKEGSEKMPMHSQMQEQKGRSLPSIQGLGQRG